MEFVYVVKRYDLFDLSFPHGFRRPGEVPLETWLDRIRSRGFFVERRQAERDSSMKQVIPYCVISKGDEIFLLRRKRTGGEARLFGLRSIGVGGHINPVDSEEDPLEAGLRREIEEEIVLTGSYRAEPLGVINDESQDVGSVHFGLVYGIHPEGEVRVRETDQLEGSFVPKIDLAVMRENERETFESWSALILDRLAELA